MKISHFSNEVDISQLCLFRYEPDLRTKWADHAGKHCTDEVSFDKEHVSHVLGGLVFFFLLEGIVLWNRLTCFLTES